jgi:2-polyprenyl-3-methyl-5-hydroxy-6-metoxy-1,4-benzoquinol methylase
VKWTRAVSPTPNPDTIEHLVDTLLKSYQAEPVDLLGIGDAEGEYRYLTGLRPTYVRTVHDIVDQLNGHDPRSVKVLEIGCFLGLVSIALARVGFQVTATDIPEFLRCARLRERLDRAGVCHQACNLRDYRLPFEDETFDVVVMCEVLEHLNFNPLPIICESNRVIKPHGVAYVALPNLAHEANRRRLLGGESIHNPIKDFFAQLDPKKNMIVGLHWREYTTAEVKEMLEEMGFAVMEQRYVSMWLPASNSGLLPKRWAKKMIHRFLNNAFARRLIYAALFDAEHDPSLRDSHVTFARKNEMCRRRFYFTEATSPGPP